MPAPTGPTLYPFTPEHTTSLLEHEKRVVEQNKALELVDAFPDIYLPDVPEKKEMVSNVYSVSAHGFQRVDAARERAQRTLFDVCKFWLPEFCMVQDEDASVGQGYIEPIEPLLIPADMPYSAYLRHFLRSDKLGKVSRPAGFSAAHLQKGNLVEADFAALENGSALAPLSPSDVPLPPSPEYLRLRVNLSPFLEGENLSDYKDWAESLRDETRAGLEKGEAIP